MASNAPEAKDLQNLTRKQLLELERKVQEQEELQRTISSLQQTLTAIPPEIIAEYNEPKSERKEIQNHAQNI